MTKRGLTNPVTNPKSSLYNITSSNFEIDENGILEKVNGTISNISAIGMFPKHAKVALVKVK